MNARVTRRSGLVLVAATIMMACGGGGDGGTTGPVTEPVATVSVALATSDIIVGQSTQATVTLRDASNNVLTGRTVTWSSSNTSVASVSTTGQVTGVAEGSANIIATSEGKTGQASISVGPDPAANPHITGLTVTQNGTPANLQQVAGTLDLQFTLELPAGYSGTLSLTIDSVTLHSEVVSAPAIRARLSAVAGSEPEAVVVTSEKTIHAETSNTVFSVTADEIRELPLLSNRDYDAILRLTPAVTGGPSTEQHLNIRTANPLHAHMLYRIDGVPVMGTDGRSYTHGSGEGAVVFANYGTQPVESFSIALAGASATYGSPTGAVLNVIQRIDRPNQKIFSIVGPLEERKDVTWVLDKVTVGGTQLDPQVDLLGGSFTSNLDYSGWANSPQQAQLLTPPNGVTYVQVEIPSTNLFDGAPTHGIAGIDRYSVDNLGPDMLPGSGPILGFLDRETMVGADAMDAMHGFGVSGNAIGPDYDLAAGLHLDRLVDVSGISASVTYYAAPVADADNLFTPQYQIGLTTDLAGIGGWGALGVRASDGMGNTSDWHQTTSAANRRKWDGSLSLDLGLGIDYASFQYSDTKADLSTSGGVPRDFSWNTPVLNPSWCWFLTVSNATVGLTDNWLSLRGSFNGTWGLGNGALRDRYQVQPATGGVSGGSTFLGVKQLVDQVGNNLGLTDRQGIYNFELQARDAAGTGISPWMQPLDRKFNWDWVAPAAPVVTVSDPIVPGTTANGFLTGTDNVALRRALLGFVFEYTSSLFFGNKVYIPAGDVSIPTVNHAPVTSFNMPLGGIVPVGFWFFNPFTGVIDWGNFYRSSAISAQLIDKAHNMGPITFAPFANTAAVPSPAFITAAFASIASTTWCPGTCAGGGTNSVTGLLRYHDTRPSGLPVIEKAMVFGIPLSGGGLVYPLGKGTSFTETPAGGGRDIEFPFTLDLRRYCGPPGGMQVFIIAYSADRAWIMKINPFFFVSVLAADLFSNKCNEA